VHYATDINVSEAHEVLVSHPLYDRLRSFHHAREFMAHHVFAVWDFFSLLKRLQREVTCVETPWLPRGLGDHARFILEIVLSEESDEAIDSGFISHFELYLSAMSEISADRTAIDGFLARLETGADPFDALAHDEIPDFVQDFVSSTLRVALHGEPHEVAASFCHGRENLLPDVLTGIQSGLGSEIDQAPIFKHYLQRHITLDHDEHGPLALRLLTELCDDDQAKIDEANRAGVEAIQARGRLWDGIMARLESGS
jgi:Protein of unknown function (DUF3050)